MLASLTKLPIPSWLNRISMESPFRYLTKVLLKQIPVSVRTRELWGISSRPGYLLGLLNGAVLARYQQVPEICALEFGVAGGQGLLALQSEAEVIERETGVGIKVYGFDRGSGLPNMINDYRDHPDYWKPGDFPMDVSRLRPQLQARTQLILGDVEETAREFVESIQTCPIGFISFDLDLYSSTTHALTVLTHPHKRMLRQVPLYFDDVIESFVSHRFAGELLAIDEFNEGSETVKIDQWRGVKCGRPFPGEAYLDKMYIAYDLDAISAAKLEREVRRLPLEGIV
ncbi:MAG: hypothetical protein NW703_17245 [Nitrospiraceae bacterium]